MNAVPTPAAARAHALIDQQRVEPCGQAALFLAFAALASLVGTGGTAEAGCRSVAGRSAEYRIGGGGRG